MSLLEFFRLAAAHFKFMVLAGVILAAVVFASTRREKKEFTSQTLVNTGVVSGYNLESSGGGKIDYNYSNNEIENLISLATSYETNEELATRMLAKYIILTAPDPELITLEGWEELKKPNVHAVRKAAAVPGDEAKTYQNILRLRSQPGENPVQDLLYSAHPFFGVEQMQTTRISREGKSDMLRFKYSTSDPAVCRQTLVLLVQIFVEKHRRMKEVQTSDVLGFFEKATNDAKSDLNTRENDMLAFMVKNKIINYYEQTRFIAAKKEDLDENYFKELMVLAGADSARVRLEREMGKHISLPELNRRLEGHRTELSDVEQRIAKIEIATLDSLPKDGTALRFLKKRSDQIKAEMRGTANAAFATLRTPEGVEVKDLMTQWLNQVIENEQAFARLGVLRLRKLEFDGIYSKFAPWGSHIKRKEREIDVAERAYLENLHSYNQARLHQFNMMLEANLNIVDPPYMPAKPASSKRAMLVIVAFLAGFVLALVVVVALELLDPTLKNPLRASTQTGLEVAGAFPKFPEKTSKRDPVDHALLLERAVGQFLQNIKLGLRGQNVSREKPRRILFASTRAGEGKSFVIQQTIEKMRLSGDRVARFFPGDDSEQCHADDFAYRPDHRFFEIQTEAALLARSDTFEPSQFDFIFLEVPPLLTDAYPVDLTAQYDLPLFVARANRTWTPADAKALRNFTVGAKNTPRLVLNAVLPEALETTLGEIPRRRSPLRIWLKRAVLGKK